MYHRESLRRVKFVKVRMGTDVRFISACLRRGLRVYTTSDIISQPFGGEIETPIHGMCLTKHYYRIKMRKLCAQSTFKNYVNRSSRP